MKRLQNKAVLSVAVVMCLLSGNTFAQKLSYDNHGEIKVPESATIRVGPFYSEWTFSQDAGFRYVRSAGTGTNYLFSGRRGTIIEDGWEYPIIPMLSMKNYLPISQHMGLDLSVNVKYEYYPMKTQESDFIIDVVEEGADVNLSTEIEVTDTIKTRLYDKFIYKTDYIDLRGKVDKYGGQRYEYMDNTIGADTDFLLFQDQNLGIGLSRLDVIPQNDIFKDQEHIENRESVYYEIKPIDPVMWGVSADFSQTQYAQTSHLDTAFQDYSVFLRAKLTDRTMGEVRGGYSLSSIADAAPDSEDQNNSMSGALTFDTEFSKEMSQSVGIQRGQRNGFTAPVEIYDSADYMLSMKGEVVKNLSLYSSYSAVEIPDSAQNGYTDIDNGIIVVVGMTDFMTLNISSAYTIRRNEQKQGYTSSDSEMTSDYDTWSTKIGTGFMIIDDLSFTLDAEHIERISDSDDLAYSRDVLSGNFKYKHKF